MNKTCFIVCPIGQEGTDVRKNSDQLLKFILRPVCEKFGFECIRVDELNTSDSITETILTQLKESDLVIADLSNHNPNAFFELGYRTALQKPVIHLKRKGETLPFDVSSIRTFDYDLQDLDSVEELKNRLSQTINSFDFSPTNANQGFEQKESINSQILVELFKIQDELKLLKDSINANNSSTISVLADKLAVNSTPESAETTLIKSLFGNPEIVKMLLQESIKQATTKKESS